MENAKFIGIILLGIACLLFGGPALIALFLFILVSFFFMWASIPLILLILAVPLIIIVIALITDFISVNKKQYNKAKKLEQRVTNFNIIKRE